MTQRKSNPTAHNSAQVNRTKHTNVSGVAIVNDEGPFRKHTPVM